LLLNLVRRISSLLKTETTVLTGSPFSPQDLIDNVALLVVIWLRKLLGGCFCWMNGSFGFFCRSRNNLVFLRRFVWIRDSLSCYHSFVSPFSRATTTLGSKETSL